MSAAGDTAKKPLRQEADLREAGIRGLMRTQGGAPTLGNWTISQPYVATQYYTAASLGVK